MTIPSSRSLIFEVKSPGSELAFFLVLRLRKTSGVVGRHRASSEDFGLLRLLLRNDCVVFKNPSTPRIKISLLYLGKSWQVYLRGPCQNFQRTSPPFYTGVLPRVKKIVGMVCSNSFEHVQLPKLNEVFSTSPSRQGNLVTLI